MTNYELIEGLIADALMAPESSERMIPQNLNFNALEAPATSAYGKDGDRMFVAGSWILPSTANSYEEIQINLTELAKYIANGIDDA